MAEDLAGLSIPIEASTALLRQQLEQAAQIVGGTTDRMDKSLGKFDKALDRSGAASRALKRAIGDVQKEIDAAASGLVNSADKIDRRLGVLGQGVNTASRAADIEAWGRELDRLEGKFDPVTTAAKRYEAEVADLQDAQRAGIVTGDAYGRELQRIADAYDPATIAARKLREEAEKDAAAFRVLEDRLDSLGAATRRAAENQAKLDKALAEGRISYERYTVLSRALNDTGRAGETAARGTKLAAHELTNLTYQLQDTVVSLAGGMNPLLVLMQQGPQATSAVGGVGRALSLLVSPAGLATMAVGGVAIGLGAVIIASEKHQKSVLAVNTATRLMGDAFGLSAAALEELAVRSAETGKITVTAARAQEAAYIRTGKIGAESMEALIGLSRDYAAATEKSADEAQADLAGLFSDPVAGMERLQAAYGILTAKEMEHVRQLKATGREEEARVLVADKLAVRVRGLADNTTTFAQAWERVGRAIGNAFDAVGQATAPETNAQAIKRLEEERRRLIEARNLDQARVDAETGGAAGREAVPIDSRLAAPGMATQDRDIAAKDAELARRRAIEARAREQAALLKDVRDKDRFQVEADEITRAARPLGTQVDAVTEKVTKLKRAFGEDMAGASNDAKVALAGLENQLADLNTVAANGGDLDAYKRKRQAEADKQAAGMVGPAREKFLARQRQEIELIGTATSASERKAQVDAAGAAVTNSQTQAIAAQNAQNTVAVRGAVAAADAYRDSMAAGIEADARRQAQSEAVTSAIDVEARTRQIVAEKAADEAVSLAQATQQLELETEAQRQVAAATDDGVASRMEAERQAQVAKVTSTALAAAQAAEAAGNVELAKRLRDLANGYDRASKSAASLSKIDALKQYNQQQRDALEQQRLEASLVGRTADERTRALAAHQAEVQIRQRGIDITKELSAEERRVVDQTRQLASETADLQIATERSRDAWAGVGSAIDDAVVRPLESAIDAIVKGQGETVKWGNLWRAALTSIAVDAGKMALVNPAKNALGIGGGNSPSLWDLGGGTGSGGISLTNSNGSGVLSLGGMASKASGGWLDRQLGGGITSASNWLNTPVYGGTYSAPAFVDTIGGAQIASPAVSGAQVPGGVTYGDAIGGVGYGIGAISSFANNKPVSGIANTAATVMSFIPGLQMYAPIVAIAGTLLEGLFGQDRGTPTAAATVTYNGADQVASSYNQDNDGSLEQAQQLLSSIDAATAKFIGLTGGKTTDQFGVGIEAADGKYKARTLDGELAGTYGNLDQAVIAAFKSNVSKGLISASDDVLKAVANSTKTDINEWMADISFASGFQDRFEAMNGAADPVDNQIKTYAENAAKIGEAIKTYVTDFTDTAARLGLATETELTAAAHKSITAMMGLGKAAEPLRGVAAVTKQAEIEFEQFRPALLALGYTAAEVADMAVQYTAKLVQARADAVAITQREGAAAIAGLTDPLAKTSALDRLDGLGLDRTSGVIGGLAQVITDVDAAAAAGTLTIEDERRALADLDRQLDAGYLTADQYTTVVGYLTQAWADNATVFKDAATAAKETAQAEQQLADYRADIQSRLYAAVGADRFSGLLALDARQRKELADAKANGYDVTQLVQLQGGERATKSFQLAQADVLAAYDQQIAAQQDFISGLQDGAVALEQVARQFRKVRDNLAISEDAPISPQERIGEAERQWAAALKTYRDAAASQADRDAAAQTLQQLAPTLTSIEKTNSAGTADTLYKEVMRVLDELGRVEPTDGNTAEKQLETAQASLKELQQARKDAASLGQKQYGAMGDLLAIMNQSYVIQQAMLVPLQRMTGTTTNATIDEMIARITAATLPDVMTWAQAQGPATAQKVLQAADQKLGWENNPYRYNASADVAGLGGVQSSADWLSVLRSVGYSGAGDPWEVNSWISAYGQKDAYETAMRAWARERGIPGFATGGNHIGGLRVVGERGPELEATGPARIWTADQIATAVAAARGDLGPNVVGFLPAGRDGGAGAAALIRAVESVGGKVDRLSGRIEEFARAEGQQRGAIADDLTSGLAAIKDEVAELPRRIAAQG